jgi:hypothetical protein
MVQSRVMRRFQGGEEVFGQDTGAKHRLKSVTESRDHNVDFLFHEEAP